MDRLYDVSYTNHIEEMVEELNCNSDKWEPVGNMVYDSDLCKYYQLLRRKTPEAKEDLQNDTQQRWAQKKEIKMQLSKEKFYIITRERAEYGRRGQYELTTADGKSHCFFMDDTLGYEYFPVESKVEDAPDVKDAAVEK